MEFFDWSVLGTFAGATAAVGILTQLTKGIKIFDRLPTQIWSYVLALIVLAGSLVFTNGIDFANMFDIGRFALVFINAAMVSIASNGGYEVVKRIINGLVMNVDEYGNPEDNKNA